MAIGWKMRSRSTSLNNPFFLNFVEFAFSTNSALHQNSLQFQIGTATGRIFLYQHRISDVPRETSVSTASEGVARHGRPERTHCRVSPSLQYVPESASGWRRNSEAPLGARNRHLAGRAGRAGSDGTTSNAGRRPSRRIRPDRRRLDLAESLPAAQGVC